MRKSYKIKNFKALKSAELEFSNLNLFTGLNGMGKSSFLQVLLLLRQSYLQNLLQNKELGLNGNLVNIGLNRDVYSQYGEEKNIYFELEITDNQIAKWTFNANATDSISKNNDVLTCVDSNVNEDFFNLNLFKEGFQYLSAERVSPQSSFETSAYEVIKRKQLGNRGEFATHYLALNKEKELAIPELKHQSVTENDSTLLKNVEAWLQEISPGISLKTQLYPNMDKVKLAFQYDAGRLNVTTNEFRPTNVGFGITYILSVIVAILSAKKGDILIIENPEAHLHPRGQSRIGHLMALAAGQGVQFFIETHSDHVLNGIRVAAKKDSEYHVINADNVKIFFFHREEGQEEHATSIFTPKLDDNGKIDKWPEGFLMNGIGYFLN
ncbi:DUF3696 domain-containing protein [Candidatus Halobeggiatoa sp. HSG11]|nr:DUF3696 domain-containing protein [Candidatus Halobeggiatoa sp. HSG11]